MDDNMDVVVSGIQDCSTRDRLSELPDSLLHTILSSMEMRAVARTALLSKRWKNLWTSVPCLNFLWLNDFDLFKNSVNRALALWKGPKILKFSLHFMFDKSVSSDIVDSWLRFAIEKQVEHLSLNLAGLDANLYHMGSQYCLPQRLYSCSSITKLSLISCKLKINDKVRVRWNRLKSLSIEGREYIFEEDDMNRILRGAPNLEVLKLSFLETRDGNLNIESTSLKMLKIHRTTHRFMRINDEANNTSLRISAPNLESLGLFGVWFSKCLLNVPCVSNAILGFHHRSYYYEGYIFYDKILVEEMLRQVFLSIRHVENLTLSSCCSKVLVELKKKGIVVYFPNTKILKLIEVREADRILVLEMFPKLMMLILQLETLCSTSLSYSDVDKAYHSFPNNPSLDLPHLRKVEITLHPFETSIIPIAEILLKNVHVLEKMVLRYQPYGAHGGMLIFPAEEAMQIMSRPSPTAEVLRRMPRSSPTAEIILIN